MKTYPLKNGYRHPPGAFAMEDGVNFCLFSRHAKTVQLRLYEKPDSVTPFQVIDLDSEDNCTFFFWHVFVVGMKGEEHISYTWKIDGDTIPEAGHRFDPSVEILDPWARATTDSCWQRKLNREAQQNSPEQSMRAMVLPVNGYDWQGDKPLHRAYEKEIIYELHVGGFTRHSSSGVKHPGTFAALIEKIPYLQKLGITTVELLPVMAFDRQDLPDNARDLGLENYWGYATHSFFSPHPGYCTHPHAGRHGDEFRDMVKALHSAGISVILDVVYNHTAEGGEDGPVMNFKGIMNELFYHLEQAAPDQPKKYKNYSGCGNTVNCNHPFVTRFIIESLEYWVKEFHVDGFRFDLASILARGETGAPMYHAPVVWGIEFSAILANTRLIAEAWDAGGLYQVGGFPGFRWAEWNGRYRDLVRQFVKGDGGLIAELATRLTGSSDLYQSSGRLPVNSINFITCHDGFTLNDMVSYNEKQNQANGENGRDGDNHNYSWNCGAEGTTENKKIVALRLKQVKNFMALLLLSQGVPMILAGDEVLRSQQGNNNCYCQNNNLSWFDWNLIEENAEMFAFTSEMIRFRKRHPSLNRRHFLTGTQPESFPLPDITWHGKELGNPQWHDSSARILACTLGRVEANEEDLHIIFNMSANSLSMPLPKIEDRDWYLAIDTSRSQTEDIIKSTDQQQISTPTVRVAARSILVCESRLAVPRKTN